MLVNRSADVTKIDVRKSNALIKYLKNTKRSDVRVLDLLSNSANINIRENEMMCAIQYAVQN
jgi:uncharacterized membrane protein YvbJ